MLVQAVCHEKFINSSLSLRRTAFREQFPAKKVDLYRVSCSLCGREAFAPFKPTPGKPIYCPECLLQQLDISESDYVLAFVAFLANKLGESSSVKAVKASGEECDILITPKGEKPKLGCRIKWKAKYPDKLVPTIAIYQISTKDAQMKILITEFIAKNENEGQW